MDVFMDVFECWLSMYVYPLQTFSTNSTFMQLHIISVSPAAADEGEA